MFPKVIFVSFFQFLSERREATRIEDRMNGVSHEAFVLGFLFAQLLSDCMELSHRDKGLLNAETERGSWGTVACIAGPE